MNRNEALNLLNIAITRRNIALHRGNELLRLGWEARAKHFAKLAGTKLVQMPGNPAAVIAEAFVKLLPW